MKKFLLTFFLVAALFGVKVNVILAQVLAPAAATSNFVDTHTKNSSGQEIYSTTVAGGFKRSGTLISNGNGGYNLQTYKEYQWQNGSYPYQVITAPPQQDTASLVPANSANQAQSSNGTTDQNTATDNINYGGPQGDQNGAFSPTQGGTNSATGIYDPSASGNYQPLSPITDPTTGQPINTGSFAGYLQAIYRIGIGICFVLGVIMFTWAGIEYIVSEALGTKADAKKRMQGALIGLAIALGSYILLNTINPDLLKFQDININAPVPK